MELSNYDTKSELMTICSYYDSGWLSFNDYLTIISHFSPIRYTNSPTYSYLYTALIFLASKRSICFTKEYYLDFTEESDIDDLLAASFILFI